VLLIDEIDPLDQEFEAFLSNSSPIPDFVPSGTVRQPSGRSVLTSNAPAICTRRCAALRFITWIDYAGGARGRKSS